MGRLMARAPAEETWTKPCLHCGEVRSAIEYYKMSKRRHKDGRDCVCKSCRRDEKRIRPEPGTWKPELRSAWCKERLKECGLGDFVDVLNIRKKVGDVPKAGHV